MKNRKRTVFAVLTGIFLLSITMLNAQTSVTSRSRSSSASSTFRKDEKDKEERKGAVRDFVMAVIGGMLRHPDPTIRKQAIQAISMGMVGDEGTSGSSNEGGVRNLFSVSREGSRSSNDETSTGVGGAVFIPDLYVLLSDPDPEVRDIASVGLDMIFQTDSTLLRFMSDPEPLIRKYATQIFAKKSISQSDTQTSASAQEQLGAVRDLLALRTMLVRLKYEKEPDVRKTITDTLDWYVKYGGDTRNTGSRERGSSMFGVEASMAIQYLNDPDPEIRKQAIKTIAARETTDDMLVKLMERLRVEKDEGVRTELQTALDTIRNRQTYDIEGRGGGGGGAGLPQGAIR